MFIVGLQAQAKVADEFLFCFDCLCFWVQGSAEFPAKCSLPQRAASLIRFRQKRKERCFDKKVRYGVRQEVALRCESDREHTGFLIETF